MRLSIISMVLFAACSFAHAETFINQPGIENGQHYLVDAGGMASTSPEGYCTHVMRCIYNTSGCTIANAQDLFSANSRPDGVCKALGFTKALAFTMDRQSNAFGQYRTYNAEGHLVDLTQEKKLRMRRKRNDTSCIRLDPAHRSFVYKKINHPVYSTITCE